MNYMAVGGGGGYMACAAMPCKIVPTPPMTCLVPTSVFIRCCKTATYIFLHIFVTPDCKYSIMRRTWTGQESNLKPTPLPMSSVRKTMVTQFWRWTLTGGNGGKIKGKKQQEISFVISTSVQFTRSVMSSMKYKLS
jgi:hypothetical protein